SLLRRTVRARDAAAAGRPAGALPETPVAGQRARTRKLREAIRDPGFSRFDSGRAGRAQPRADGRRIPVAAHPGVFAEEILQTGQSAGRAPHDPRGAEADALEPQARRSI